MTLQENIETLVKLALEEDLDERGDITSRLTIPAGMTFHGQIVAKVNGVIAGLPVVEAVFRHVDPAVTVTPLTSDGCPVASGSVVCEIEGSGRSLLTGERTALNFLQRLSGIATLTAQYVKAVAGTHTVILDTRKTTPGWRMLEKYAVRVGGGHNHRMGLYDVVMIKDNHIAAVGGVRETVARVRADPEAAGLDVVLEVETLDQLGAALDLGVTRILLDNMDETTMHAAVMMAAGRVPLEASGNMTLARAAAAAAVGVDFISVGALTHSAPALDLSMRLMSHNGA